VYLIIHQAFSQTHSFTSITPGQPSSGKMRRTAITRIVEATKAIGLCHNVTPIVDGNQFVRMDGFILLCFADTLCILATA
jgi:hypothetical protein